MIAALFTGGKVYTGRHHGDAFSKMTEDEKNSDMVSGFVDPLTMKFVADNGQFYLKKIIVLRHGDSEGCWDSPITDLGRNQAERAAAFLLRTGLEGYRGYCSPTRRCIQTAFVIECVCGIPFDTNEKLSKQYSFENGDDFVYRVGNTLDALPEKSLLISHCDFIKVMAQLTLGIKIKLPERVPNCSVTFIDNQTAVWLARDIIGE